MINRGVLVIKVVNENNIYVEKVGMFDEEHLDGAIKKFISEDCKDIGCYNTPLFSTPDNLTYCLIYDKRKQTPKTLTTILTAPNDTNYGTMIRGNVVIAGGYNEVLNVGYPLNSDELKELLNGFSIDKDDYIALVNTINDFATAYPI